MARQDPITVAGEVNDGLNLIIDGSSASTGAIDIFEVGGGDAAEVKREIDSNGDGTYDTTVEIRSTGGEFQFQPGKPLNVSVSQNSRIRITNTSGNVSNYYIVGYEVPDGT